MAIKIFHPVFVTILLIQLHLSKSHELDDNVYRQEEESIIAMAAIIRNFRLDTFLTCTSLYYPEIGQDIAEKVKQDICNLDPKSESRIKLSKSLSDSKLGCAINSTNMSMDAMTHMCSGKEIPNTSFDDLIDNDCEYGSNYDEGREIVFKLVSKYIPNNEEFKQNKIIFQYVNEMITNYCQIIDGDYGYGIKYTNGHVGLPNVDTSLDTLTKIKVEPNKNGDQVLKCIQKKMPNIKSINNDICSKYVPIEIGSPSVCRGHSQRRVLEHKIDYEDGNHYGFTSCNWSLPPKIEVNLWYQTLKECINAEPYVSISVYVPPEFVLCYNREDFSKVSNASSNYVSASECFFKGPSMAIAVDKDGKYEMCRKLIFVNMATNYDKEYILCKLYPNMLHKVARCMDMDWMDKDRELFRIMMSAEMKHRNKCINDNEFDDEHVYDKKGKKIAAGNRFE